MNKPGDVLTVEYYITIKGMKEGLYVVALQNLLLSDRTKKQKAKRVNYTCVYVCYCPITSMNVITRHYCPPDMINCEEHRAIYKIFLSSVNLSSVKSLVLIFT